MGAVDAINYNPRLHPLDQLKGTEEQPPAENSKASFQGTTVCYRRLNIHGEIFKICKKNSSRNTSYSFSGHNLKLENLNPWNLEITVKRVYMQTLS